ncbi:MAG: hypothetical protein AAF416_21240, partial [Pseudomonadota bacterium]
MATFIVTSVDDETDDDTSLSLREALALANADPGADLITFADELSGSTLTLTMGQLEIDGDLIIDGDLDDDATPDITLVADSASRVFDVLSGAVTLDGLTITGGDPTSAPQGIFNPFEDTLNINLDQAGGGIRSLTEDMLTITNTAITDNRGEGGGGILSLGALQLENVDLLRNDAVRDGGPNSSGTIGDGGGVWVF